jgi:menaquinone-dependent protoporphyrinogen IX oxidase
MTTLIVYRSFLGTSKKYARWLHEAIPSDLLEFKRANSEVLKAYDAVVIICGIYATRLSLAGYLGQNWAVLQGKQVAFVSVAGSPADNIFSTKAYSRIPDNIRASITHFHLAGGLGRMKASEVKKDNINPVIDYLTTK